MILTMWNHICNHKDVDSMAALAVNLAKLGLSEKDLVAAFLPKLCIAFKNAEFHVSIQ